MISSERYIRAAQWLLPSPFTIAVIITLVTILLALTLTGHDTNKASYLLEIAGFWQKGFWHLLTFAMQMMLILVLGHALALTKPVENLIHLIADRANTTAKAAFLVTFSTMLMAFLNWGLGLIFGAILARKIAEFSKAKNVSLHYPLIGACGYSGLMVWHGGLSGSATLKVTESNHFLIEQIGQIPLTETVFSPLNICVTIALFTVIPLAMAILGSKLQPTDVSWVRKYQLKEVYNHKPEGAEKLDRSKLFCKLFSLCFLAAAVYEILIKPKHLTFEFMNLNFINFMLFGLALWFLGTFEKFSQAIEEAIGGASGIMVQFPLYAGIAGIMQYSGLIHVFSDFIVNVATPKTYTLWTLLSAGVVNMFVPSGGGQWAVQGPILADAATTLGVSYPKAIMAFVYGDQLTNMLQPFWALPLLGITGLKAKDILPYTFVLLLLGASIFILGLLLLG